MHENANHYELVKHFLLVGIALNLKDLLSLAALNSTLLHYIDRFACRKIYLGQVEVTSSPKIFQYPVLYSFASIIGSKFKVPTPFFREDC